MIYIFIKLLIEAKMKQYIFLKKIVKTLFFSMLFFNVSALAEFNQDALNLKQSAEFNVWKDNFREIALQKGFDSDFLDQILPQLTYLPKVIISDTRQSEFLLTFWDYVNRVISDKRIQTGKEMLKKHHNLLVKVSEKYGIQPEILIAFWGLETNYGTYKGNVDTLNALATLAFDKRRRTFFTKELLALLSVIETGEKTHFTGSWAGAFGNFQFMPTTYLAYAVDADGDNQKDIINSLPDAFESAANYLSKMGWKKNQSWGTEVRITKRLNWNKINQSKTLPVKTWKEMGVFPANGKAWRQDYLTYQAHLVLPSGIDGPAFLVYPNYDLIMRWNNSTLYALSVGLLADKIKYKYAPIYKKPHQTSISRKDVKEIQKLLKEKGFYNDSIDGVLGKKTRQSIRAYQKTIKWDEDGYPSKKLLLNLQKRKK